MQTDVINQTPADVDSAPDMEQDAAIAHTPEGALSQVRQPITLSGELIAYAALLLFALLLRLPQLGAIPLNDSESHEALAVLHTIQPNVQGSPVLSYNPLMFTFNTIFMSVMGATDGTARLATVLLGALIVLMPVLYRRWLGISTALIMAGLLAFSPVLLTASRTMSGAVWAVALALAAVYFIGSYVESRRPAFGIGAAISLLLLVFASEPAGFIIFLAMLFGLIFAIGSADEIDPEHSARRTLFQTLRQWPWMRSVIFGGAALALAATAFFLHPEGMSHVGEALYQGLRGFIIRPPGYPLAFPLFVSIVYEPVLWVFGLAGAYMVVMEGGSFLRRFLLGWLLAALAASFIYAGAEPAHALWLTIPLAGLSAITINRILTPVRDQFMDVPGWGMWVHGLAMIVMLAIIGIDLLTLSRLLLSVSPAWLPPFSGDQHPGQALIMIALVLVLIVMTFLLVSSTWGAKTAWRGVGIGVLVFLVVFSIGSGWRAAVTGADDPRELWRVRPVSNNLNLLRDTLKEVSLKSVGMSTDIQITVAGIPSDSPVAWALHDYQFVNYVPAVSTGIDTPIVIAPKTDDTPKMGAQYVGQDFAVHYDWDRSTMTYWDFLPWLYLRETRTPPSSDDRVVVWVRSDVYGLPADTGTTQSSASGQSNAPEPQPIPPVDNNNNQSK